MLIPTVIEKSPTGERPYDIYSRLLKENIVSEKNWILFLFCISYVMSLVTNFQAIKFILQKKELELQKMTTVDFIDRTFSSDEVVVQRHVS